MHRDFKGIWIPREIWLNPNLTILEKTLWAEIDSLSNRDHGGCYASNAYLSEFFGVSERHIRNMLLNLKKLNLLEDVSFNGRTRVIRSISPPKNFVKEEDRNYSSTQNGTVETGTTVPPSTEPQFLPPLYIDNKAYNKEKVNQKTDAIPSGGYTKVSSKKIDPSSEAKERALKFYESMKKVDPGMKSPDLNAWGAELDKIHRIDKRPWEEIDKVIDYRAEDEFWSSNCLSPLKLRKHFQSLLVKAKMTPKAITETAPSNEELAKKAAETYKSKENSCHCRIEPCHGYVEFTPIGGFAIPVQVRYDSKHFRAELQQNLVRNKFIKHQVEQS